MYPSQVTMSQQRPTSNTKFVNAPLRYKKNQKKNSLILTHDISFKEGEPPNHLATPRNPRWKTTSIKIYHTLRRIGR